MYKNTKQKQMARQNIFQFLSSEWLSEKKIIVNGDSFIYLLSIDTIQND